MAAPTTPATVTVALTCQVYTEPAGDTHDIPYRLGFAVTAPDTVRPGEWFTVAVQPEPLTFSPRFSSRVRDLRLCFVPPRGAGAGGAVMSGGSGLGGTEPYTAPADGALVLHAPGPFVSGTPFILPCLTWTVTAGPGGVVEVALGGPDGTGPVWGYHWEQPSKDMSGVVTGRPDGTALLARTRIIQG
ncbi:hypothetical protein ACIBU0_15225 [Streptomyces sp. NPDC049627]|uniref:hypothetical protein n=1 Tax=Streptomyces sp. NPDC049627 TaxID=3365595 RepID=UPI0037911FF6